jgi:hypothetical protein
MYETNVGNKISPMTRTILNKVNAAEINLNPIGVATIFNALSRCLCILIQSENIAHTIGPSGPFIIRIPLLIPDSGAYSNYHFITVWPPFWPLFHYFGQIYWHSIQIWGT